MNISVVIQTLRELADWLECSKQNQNRIMGIINELEGANIDEHRLHQLKFQLSTEGMFHHKWLGDTYIPDFIGDGTAYAWWNYLLQVADICQKNL